MAAFI